MRKFDVVHEQEWFSAWQGDDAPPKHGNWGELAWNFGRMLGTFRKRGPRGPLRGQPALVIPGFLCSDQTTFSLRRGLARAGFRVHGWKQGWNLGARPDTLETLGKRIDSLGHDRPIVIIGWSLGGLFAREYARYHSEQVKAVITLGSPFSGDPRQNNVWKLYERVAKHPVDQPPIPRITEKPPVPHLAIWSRRDGLIAPRAARAALSTSATRKWSSTATIWRLLFRRRRRRTWCGKFAGS